MIIETREVREYHDNGNLRYECTFGVVAPIFQHLYSDKILTGSGEILIRTGVARKFRKNGDLEWQLNYAEDGSVVKTEN